MPRPMMSFRLDTLDGSVSAVAFPEAFAQFGIHLQPDAAVMLCGSVRKDNGGGGNTLTVDEVYPIDEVPERFTLGLSLHVNVGTWSEERMRELKDVIRRHPGKTPLNLCLLYPDNAKVHLRAASHLTVRVSEALVKECGKIVDGLYVGTRKEAGLRAPPESKWKRNGG
jgi:DNA polymerase III alpha subunit